MSEIHVAREVKVLKRRLKNLLGHIEKRSGGVVTSRADKSSRETASGVKFHYIANVMVGGGFAPS
jgi:hypothetical protein